MIVDTGEMDIDEVLEKLAELTLASASSDSAEVPEELTFRTADGEVLGESDFSDADFSDADFSGADFSDEVLGDYDDESAPEEFFITGPEDFTLEGGGDMPETEEDWEALEQAFGMMDDEEAEREALCTVAIVGRPNVGSPRWSTASSVAAKPWWRTSRASPATAFPTWASGPAAGSGCRTRAAGIRMRRASTQPSPARLKPPWKPPT